MQWSTGLNAGFSSGKPWLPVETSYQRYTVAEERKAAESIYSWYANLLKLRHENAAVRDGEYVPFESGNPNVFVFGRKAENNEIVLVALNTSSAEQTVDVAGIPEGTRKVLMSSPKAKVPTGSRIQLAPYGVLITSAK